VEFTVASKDDRLVVIVPVSHPLASRSSVSLADLKGERFIAREQGSGTREAYEKALSDAGLSLSDLLIAAEVGDSASVVKAVVAGTGIGIVSELAAQDAIGRGAVRLLNIPVLAITRNFYIIRQKGRELSEEGDRILSVMLAVLR
jgi:DNA-binding transcriptional LysR family regulator